MWSQSEIMSCSGTLRTVRRGIYFFFWSRKPFALPDSLSMEKYFGRIREADRTQRWEDPRLVGIVRD